MGQNCKSEPTSSGLRSLDGHCGNAIFNLTKANSAFWYYAMLVLLNAALVLSSAMLMLFNPMPVLVESYASVS